jgi:predicted site-specific integrase-resolvase
MKLLRRRDVLDTLGITERQLRTMIDAGMIKPIRKRGTRAWFRSTDLEKL